MTRHFTSLLLSFLLSGMMLLPAKSAAGKLSSVADSLIQHLARAKGEEKLRLLDLLFDKTIHTDTDTARYYARQLIREATRQNNTRYLGIGYHDLGLYHNYAEAYYKAEDELKKAVEILRNTEYRKELADVYKTLAGTCFYQEKYTRAIDLSFKALDIFEKTGDHSGIISSFNNIGLLYKETGDYRAALHSYRQALQYIDRYMPDKNKAYLFENMGVAYKRLHKPDSALFFYRMAMREEQHNDTGIPPASLLFNIGNLHAFYFRPPHTDSAVFHFHQALEAAGSSHQELRADIYSSLGKMYLQQGDYGKSIASLHHSLKLADSIRNWKSQEVAHFYLYSAYKSLGAWDKSLTHLENFVDYRDSLENKEAKITIANLESKYENEKNKARIRQMETRQEWEKKMRYLLLLALVLAGMVLALLIRMLMQRRKQYRLEKQILRAETEKLDQDLRYKTRQLTSQALMMIQKNKLLDEILRSISNIKGTGDRTKKELTTLKRKLHKTMHAEEDWELFRNYFEEINKDFFKGLLRKYPQLTPSELKLSALVKLGFNIKETASLMNISPDSVKTARHILRKKLGLRQGENLYDHLQRF